MLEESIILAGGFGKRLASVVKEIPKPMAIIKGKPFLEHILNYLEKEGIKRVILAVGYKREVIQKHFGRSFKGIEIIYSVEDTPLGTGGAIKRAINLAQGEDILVQNGDTFFNINLGEIYNFHKSKNADITIALKFMEDTGRYGTVELDKDNRIVKFYEKKKMDGGLINGGIYIVKTEVIRSSSLPESFSFEKEFLENNVDKLKIYGLPFNTYFIDIGTPEDYSKAKTEFDSEI